MDKWKVTLSVAPNCPRDTENKILAVFREAFGIGIGLADYLKKRASEGGVTVLITEHQFLCFFIKRRDILGGQRIAWRNHELVSAPEVTDLTSWTKNAVAVLGDRDLAIETP